MSDWSYTAYYCEENAWHALTHLKNEFAARAVVWILGRAGHVALWKQRLAQSSEEPVIWDYHVIAVARKGAHDAWLVFDFDSVLPWGTPLVDYLAQTFPHGDRLPLAVQARFRWFDADEYQRRFHSMRAHMRDEYGEWLAPPPSWPLLCSSASDAVTVETLRAADQAMSPPAITLAALSRLIEGG